MPRNRLTLQLTNDQVEDLTNALEDYRDDFRAKEKETVFGLEIDAGYWANRAEEIEYLIRKIVLLRLRPNHS